MRIIKKYGNRRLYDTEKSAYINLEELAALIRGGETVRVQGAKDGEDLTHEVLLQVVLEQLQGGELLTESMLHRIIRSTGTDPWQLLLRKQLVAGMDMLSAQMDQVERMFQVGRPDAAWPGAWPGMPSGGPAGAEPAAEPDAAQDAEAPVAPEQSRAPSPAAPAQDPEMDALRAKLQALEARLKS